MSRSKREQKLQKAEYRSCLNELNEIKMQLQCAYSAFNEVTEPELLDACIFEISSLKSRYNRAVSGIRNLSYWSE